MCCSYEAVAKLHPSGRFGRAGRFKDLHTFIYWCRRSSSTPCLPGSKHLFCSYKVNILEVRFATVFQLRDTPKRFILTCLTISESIVPAAPLYPVPTIAGSPLSSPPNPPHCPTVNDTVVTTTTTTTTTNQTLPNHPPQPKICAAPTASPAPPPSTPAPSWPSSIPQPPPPQPPPSPAPP